MGMFDPKKKKNHHSSDRSDPCPCNGSSEYSFYSAVITEQNDEIRNTGGRL